MYAVVCDKCGNTAVLAGYDPRNYTHKETGFFRVHIDKTGVNTLDLCPECAEKLLGDVRESEG